MGHSVPAVDANISISIDPPILPQLHRSHEYTRHKQYYFAKRYPFVCCSTRKNKLVGKEEPVWYKEFHVHRPLAAIFSGSLAKETENGLRLPTYQYPPGIVMLTRKIKINRCNHTGDRISMSFQAATTWDCVDSDAIDRNQSQRKGALSSIYLGTNSVDFGHVRRQRGGGRVFNRPVRFGVLRLLLLLLLEQSLLLLLLLPLHHLGMSKQGKPPWVSS